MSDRRRGASVQRLALVVLVLAGAAAAEAQTTAAVRLTNVTVASESGATAVHIKTAGAVKYRSRLLDAPSRLVLDFDGAVYAWRKAPLDATTPPVRRVRGSQFSPSVARVVVELTRKATYTVREDGDGLTVLIPTIAADAAPAPPAAPAPKVAAAPGTSPLPATPPKASTPAAAASAIAGAVTERPPRAGGNPDAAGAEAGAIELPAPPPKKPASKRSAAPVEYTDPAPLKVAQAPSAPPAEPAPATGRRLISLDFKDADIVNLLRVLAAESGRNIVVGDDVRGKISITLRNVPWEQALQTVLEARGLEKVEREGVMRIVTTEQLTKEREARARVEEAKVKAEADVRAKVAEAALKEAEALTKKLAAEAAQKEAEARGPLREETIRLSYADPEVVAETLQGILGIPKEGQKIEGRAFIGGPPNLELYPFGQPMAPGAPAAPVSVSQDVLAKGLTIRAHKPTNTIFLRLYAADLERIKKLIRESLDIPLPQVKIEARMEILDRQALEQIGIQWGGTGAATSGSTTLVGQGLQTTLHDSGQTIPIMPGFQQGTTNIIDLVPANSGLGFGPGILAQPAGSPPPATGGFPISFQTGLPLGGNLVNLPIQALPNAGPLPAGGLAFGIVGTKFNINLALQALAEKGKTRTLARPEIVTVENSKASMSLGEEIPFATISSAGTQIQFKEALLKLEVTPTVIREGADLKIKMVVVVENNSRGAVVQLGSAGQPPAINRRKAETQVLIREGDRLIIGGVTTAVNQNTVRRVPIFGDIPILGHLFKQRENFESGRELVVFLTPSVVVNPYRQTSPFGGPAGTAPAPPAR